jgi:hypothetical protein
VNSDYQMGNADGDDKDSNNSFSYSNNSPRSLYSIMTKKTPNYLMVGHKKKAKMLEESQEVIQRRNKCHSMLYEQQEED